MKVLPIVAAYAVLFSCGSSMRLNCAGRLKNERIDPLIAPGAEAGHVHQFCGAAGFDTHLQVKDLTESVCSSCEVVEDKSVYWTPLLYAKLRNGSFTPVPVVGDLENNNGGMAIYYFDRSDVHNSSDVLTVFEPGFKMIAGDPFKRNFTKDFKTDAVTLRCLKDDPAAEYEITSQPKENCPLGLRAQVFFPSCWNGKEGNEEGHFQDHVAYPDPEIANTGYNSGPCPPSHPIRIPSVFYEVLYDGDRFKDEWVDGKHPFVFANGDPTGYGLHAVFVSGWEKHVLEEVFIKCADEGREAHRNVPQGQPNAINAADCPVLTMYSVDDQQSCRLPTLIPEDVYGLLPKLPGCNPITYGPEPAPHPHHMHHDIHCPAPHLSAKPLQHYTDVTSKGWGYLGCGLDNISDRGFNGNSTKSKNMTVEFCVDWCSTPGVAPNNGTYQHAVLEYGKECWCIDNPTHANYMPRDGFLGKCNYACAGNKNQTCGGYGATSIYKKCPEGGACQNLEVNSLGRTVRN